VNKHALFLISALVGASALVLAGCSSPGASAPATSGASGPVAVVASTDVYGSLASAVGGDFANVTAIISDPDQDPHEYQADAQNQLALSKAKVIIENGAGYDDFVDAMLSTAKNPGATVLNAADISGYDQNPADGDFNEHLWYDFPTVGRLVDQLVSALSAAAPAEASVFEANGASVKDQLTAFEKTESALKAKYAGEGAAITEPVPLYMLSAMGLDNKTPEPFSEAIENDTDVAPDVLQQTLALFSGKQVALLAYNEQTTGAQTQAVLDAANQAGIPVVPVTETLPDGTDYFGWMKGNLDAIGAALAQ
jgi:zinc/manganese transport system substrate-binding protein